MYQAFEQLDGSHPWRDACPDGYVDYAARARPGGRVAYLNFDLTRAMKLIPANHADRVTPALEKVLLETFALQIINEYDLASGNSISQKLVKPGRYMATRYLQAQHKDRRGLHSGDGRAIWLGTVRAGRVTYDVSARGTGATRLSPGAVTAGVPVRTGDTSVGYASGLADLDEMLGTVIMSEIFHRNGFPTERTLAVIAFDDGTAIGVRAAPNLLRPAHVFRYLKQERRDETRAALDYFIDRQVANGEWAMPAAGAAAAAAAVGDPKERYRRALTYLARSYGRLAAICEEEYIFNWLSWDGDNLLASGAILDYGSIRQFAGKHSKYRYDDVDRYSATLTEQRGWARYNLQVFAQAFHFAATGRKLPLKRFRNAPCLAQFDLWFEREREYRTLWRLGFEPEQIETLRRRGRSEIGDLRRALSFFEEVKVARGFERLSDGITHAPVFLIRNLLRELPAFYADKCASAFGAVMDPRQFYQVMAASYASRRDLRVTPTRAARAINFQKCYQRLLAAADGPYDSVLAGVRERAATINYRHRITGNGVIDAVEAVVRLAGEVPRATVQSAIDRFIESQVLIPGRCKAIPADELSAPTATSRLLAVIQANVEEAKETI
ncbi:MAG TPA: protein adenylyltransferase SelO family protein [Tepidisphaeraceae bacterium]|nr:protein adenylyltransferase SelO family protein [Tepidisphaeraceae bacterium]